MEINIPYNKCQSDVVIDGLCYNMPYGITPDSWDEINKVLKENNIQHYDIQMDNENFQFIIISKD